MQDNIKTKKTFNYRKFYEKETGKKIPKDFDVHHIDFNRENNDIMNLVAMPKKLHQRYHLLLCKSMPFGSIKINQDDLMPFLSGNVATHHHCRYYNYDTSMIIYQIDKFYEYIDEMNLILYELTGWFNFKLSLLNKLPDFIENDLCRYHKTNY